MYLLGLKTNTERDLSLEENRGRERDRGEIQREGVVRGGFDQNT